MAGLKDMCSADDMDSATLLEQRSKRILQAVALDRPDRTPVVLEYAGFAARVTGTPLPEFLSSTTKSVQVMIEAFHRVGNADAVDYGSFSPYQLSYIWMSKVRVPGVDLPEEDMYQVAETELMTVEDYDFLLEQGWPSFYRRFMAERVLNDVPAERLPSGQPSVDVLSEWASHGIPVLRDGVVSTPFEFLCGARSLIGFFTDLLTIPDKIEEAMQIIMPHMAPAACRRAKQGGFPAVWVGGWRAAGRLISPSLWERFVWPYFEQLVHEVVDCGLIALLHLDSDWTRDLAYFRALPKGRCILSTDGATDLLKARDLLDGHMCLMGDVGAPMLAFGEPDEVYRYSTELVSRLGPSGFILHSGCDIPLDAKLANVQAMVSAAAG